MKEKKVGPPARKQNGPKRLTEIKRQLDAKKLKDENQELLFKFSKDYENISFDDADFIMIFIHWLEENEYIIIEAKSMRSLRFELGRRIQKNLLKEGIY